MQQENACDDWIFMIENLAGRSRKYATRLSLHQPEAIYSQEKLEWPISNIIMDENWKNIYKSWNLILQTLQRLPGFALLSEQTP